MASVELAVGDRKFLMRIGVPPPAGVPVDRDTFPGCGFRFFADTTAWDVGDPSEFEVNAVDHLGSLRRLCSGTLNSPSPPRLYRQDVAAEVGAPVPSAGTRVVLVPHRIGVGGAQWWLDSVERSLTAADFEAVSLRDAPIPVLQDYSGDGLRRFEDDEAYGAAVQAGIRAFQQLRPAVVVVNTVEGLAAVDAAITSGVPVVWAIFESYAPGALWASLFRGGQPPGRAVRALERCLQQAQAVVVPCGETARLFSRFIPSARSWKIPFANRVDQSQVEQSTGRRALRRKLGFGTDNVVFVTVATVEERKNAIPLLAAFARVHAENDCVRLLIAGPGDPAYVDCLRTCIARLQLEDVVALIPSAVDAEKFIAAGDVFVSVSDIEARPVVVTEAIQLRKPLLATTAPGIGELVIHERTGLLSRPNDFGEVRKLMHRLGGDDLLRRSLATTNPHTQGIALDYQWADHVAALVGDVLDSNRRATDSGRSRRRL
jgi:glycogen(starch) synthase